MPKNGYDLKIDISLIKGKLAIAGIAALVGLTVLSNLYVIDEGERAVVTRLGTITDTWDPGIHVKVPMVDKVTRYNVRMQKTTFGRLAEDIDSNRETLSAYSNDNQIITSYRLSVTWAYDPNRIKEAYKLFGSDESRNSVFYTVVAPLVQQTSKVIFGQFTSTTIIQERARLDESLDSALKEQLKDYPINVVSVQIENVDFSKTFEQTIELTAQKKQEVEKAKNELRMVEISAQQKVAQAEAENKAVKLKADAKAYEIEVQAKAEAEAIKVKAEALKANRELIDLTVAEKWDGKLPTTSLGNSVPLLNLGEKK
ncbi:MAG TPA: hypothetical protein DCR21_07785 [Succinivibrionaceae bacterium]|nr:hypothetical protein [Succinivibrionaceae bacterium]